MFSNFQRLHPAFQAGYYLLILFALITIAHPVVLILLWLAICFALEWNTYEKGETDPKKSLKLYLTPFLIALFFGLLNAILRPVGLYTFFQFPNGRMVTWDAFLSGLQTGFRFSVSFLWLRHMQQAITSSRLRFLLKPVFPSLSLLLMLIFQFFPRFSHEAKELAYVQNIQVQDNNLAKSSRKNILQRLTAQLSSLNAWALEDSMYTALMMEQRGFGLVKKTTSYQLFTWRKRDTFLTLIAITVACAYWWIEHTGSMIFYYDPFLYARPVTSLQLLGFGLMALLAFMPFLVDIQKY